MRQLRETDEISCRRLSDHEVSSLAADQVVAETFIQQVELIEDRQTVNRYAVLDHLLYQPARIDTPFTALFRPARKGAEAALVWGTTRPSRTPPGGPESAASGRAERPAGGPK